MTVSELLARVSSRELTEWMEYATLEPFGEERADLRAGIVAATIANVYRRKGSKPLKPSDFMPAFGPEEVQSVEQQLGIVEMLNAAFGGRDLRKRRPGT